MSLFHQAADLLEHQHLQPYVLKMHLNSNNPRRHTFPLHWSDSNYMKKTRFLESEVVIVPNDAEKRQSFSNDRALNPSISGTEFDSFSSSQRAENFSKYLNRKLSIGSIGEDIGFGKSMAGKLSTAVKTPKLTPTKAFATPRRQIVPSMISRPCSDRDSVSS